MWAETQIGAVESAMRTGRGAYMGPGAEVSTASLANYQIRERKASNIQNVPFSTCLTRLVTFTWQSLRRESLMSR